METVLTVNSLKKQFVVEKGKILTAVNGVSFSINEGETLGLVGESGSGKTTVGRCILRLLEPTSGSIKFFDTDILSINNTEMRNIRSKIQLVFQEFWSSLNPHWSIERLIEEPLILHTDLDISERKKLVIETSKLVNLKRKHLKLFPSQLTGGEQQRVGIARAIITNPSFIVLDEPTSSLDPSVRVEILDLLIKLQKDLGISYLFISHDMTAVERVSHRIAIMYLGKLVEIGPTDELKNNQYHPYSRALLSAVLYPDPDRKLELFSLKGEIPSPINLADECPLVKRCPIVTQRCRESMPKLEEVTPGHFCACFNHNKGNWGNSVY